MFREQPRLDESSDGTDDLVAVLVDVLNGGTQDTLPAGLLIEQLRDHEAPLIDRRKAAWQLAEHGTPEALAALEAASAEGSPYLRATIADALGTFGGPQELALLSELLEDDDPVVARGAVRGIAGSEDPAAADTLSAILDDRDRPMSVRAEAALELASLPGRNASDDLMDAFDEVSAQDGDLWEAVLEGLGARPFSEVEHFYTDLVDSSGDLEVRTAALESLSESTREAAPFLLYVAGHDTEPAVRAAAAESLGSLEGQMNLGTDLIDLLKREDHPDVRQHLYDAIANQSDASFQHVAKHAMNETDPDTRLQAFGSAAQALSTRSFASQRRQFDGEIVPDLLDVALNDGQLHRQIQALNVLIVAGTEGARTAVRIVADADQPVLGEAARQALGSRQQ